MDHKIVPITYSGVQMNEQTSRRKPPAIDSDLNEIEILKRYDCMYTTFIDRNIYKPLDRKLTEADINKNIQDSILDYCVSHAFQGESYIAEIQMNMQYTVLQSALILTISMPLFINPPIFEDEGIGHLFSGVIGGAAFSQLSTIIGTTILSGLLNRPYTPVDGMVCRIESRGLYVGTTVINYISMLLTMSSMFIAGFERSLLDGYVQLYGGVMVIAIVITFILALGKGSEYQDKRALVFYQKYCDDDGSLKSEYIQLIEKEDPR
jgi:hypothetical protein